MRHHKFESVHNFELATAVADEVIVKVLAVGSLGGLISKKANLYVSLLLLMVEEHSRYLLSSVFVVFFAFLITSAFVIDLLE